MKNGMLGTIMFSDLDSTTVYALRHHLRATTQWAFNFMTPDSLTNFNVPVPDTNGIQEAMDREHANGK